MKKQIIRIARFQAVLLTAAVFVAGCVQIPAEPEKNPASGGEHDRSAALQCADAVLRAFQEKNYELLKEVLAENLQKEFTPEAFSQSLLQLQNTLGTIHSFEYCGELKTPVLKTLVWKVCFRRTGSDDSAIEQEILFRALIAPVHGESRVIGFGFL